MISIAPDWAMVIGLVVTVLFGFGVGCLVERVSKSLLPLSPPTDEAATEWAEFGTLRAGGFWIGLFERPIFFAAFWIQGGWPIAPSWLAYKLALYWQGANFLSFPSDPPSKEHLGYFVKKRRLGAHYAATLLVGTAANIVLAFVGVAVGKSIKL